MYEYTAKVGRVLDGDTVEAVVDLGFDVSHRVFVRLFGLNAPETKGATKQAGLVSKARLEALVLNKTVLLRSRVYNDTDKYGRCLGTIVVDGVDVNATLLKEGLAVPMAG